MNKKKTTIQNTLKTESEVRHKELIYMSRYMAMIMNKEQLATLKITG
jgi:hypothetical protein